MQKPITQASLRRFPAAVIYDGPPLGKFSVWLDMDSLRRQEPVKIPDPSTTKEEV
ncbi:hypothetical protein [Flintibacter muris]|uniref:hypothetical protein n=1 Tax=Flintibacter muris TaxID=2941327 RepID=UPI00203CFC9A|nr:hypothetical protein [Flintibacter muris]